MKNMAGKCLWVGVFLAIHPILNVYAQGTAFTYQGRLNDGAGPASGIYDFTFSLYNAGSGPSQVGPTVTNSGVGLTNGLFTVAMDFGSVFNGTTYWLQIGVRTNGAATFTPLLQRQQLTPTPYAVTAANVSGLVPASQLSGTLPAGALSGSYGSAVTLNNAGNSFSGNGSGLTGLNASQLAGTVPDAQLAANVARTNQVWLLNGNSGTAGANFLGTTDNQPLELRVNSLRALRIDPNSSGSPNIVAGGAYNFVSPSSIGSTIAGGGSTNRFGVGQSSTNSIGGSFGFIGSGEANRIGTFATDNVIGGGFVNLIDTGSDYGSIGGGGNNTIGQFTDYSTIAGGWANLIRSNAQYAFIGGGQFNGIDYNGSNSVIAGGIFNSISNAYASAVGGGEGNTISSYADHAFIGGGYYNVAKYSADFSTIGGGSNNIANGLFVTIGGGQSNLAAYTHTFIGGGANNTANGYYAAIGGGTGNQTGEQEAFIGGGQGNTASGFASSVVGGSINQATTTASTVGGGAGNSAGGTYSTIGGGYFNSVGGTYSAIGGGYFNFASGSYATVPGGRANQATGLYSFAGGRRAQAVHNGSFVWADDTDADFPSTAAEQFSIRAANGVVIQATNTALDLRGGGALRVAGMSLGSSTPVFIHRANSTNIFSNVTIIDHPQCNGNPNAVLILTPNWNPGGSGGTYNNHATGVYYDTASQRWAIFNEDSAVMPLNAAFNVLVFKP